MITIFVYIMIAFKVHYHDFLLFLLFIIKDTYNYLFCTLACSFTEISSFQSLH